MVPTTYVFTNLGMTVEWPKADRAFIYLLNPPDSPMRELVLLVFHFTEE